MKPVIAANWKMNKTSGRAAGFVESLKKRIKKTDKDIILCVPFTDLSAVADKIKMTKIKLGAENVFYGEKGAFTGEISPSMLKSSGCEYVIIGHSERRKYFNETDKIVNKKIKASLKHGLKIILCIGENLSQRRKKQEKKIIWKQLKICLKGIPSALMKHIIIAYEPVWAIGTGHNAAPEQAEEMHKHIRSIAGKKTRIIYGGSVTPENIRSLMKQKDINGVLVGGASLSIEKFAKIVNC